MSNINPNSNAIEFGSKDDPDIILAGMGNKIYLRTGGNTDNTQPNMIETISQPSTARDIVCCDTSFDSNKLCACNGDFDAPQQLIAIKIFTHPKK